MRNVPQGGLSARKPNGLWWSAGNDWADLVEKGGKAVRGKTGEFRYRVELARGANIARISDRATLGMFTDKYGRGVAGATRPDAPKDRAIDWAGVARDYDGIEITGLARIMENGFRSVPEWLAIDWDVDSGCAWTAKAIRKITPYPPVSGSDGQNRRIR